MTIQDYTYQWKVFSLVYVHIINQILKFDFLLSTKKPFTVFNVSALELFLNNLTLFIIAGGIVIILHLICFA